MIRPNYMSVQIEDYVYDQSKVDLHNQSSLRILGKSDMMELLRIIPMCVADWLGEFFEADLLKGGLAWFGTDGCYAGPWSHQSAGRARPTAR